MRWPCRWRDRKRRRGHSRGGRVAGPPAPIEREIRADRRPQPAIFLRPQADRASGVARVADPFDVHHALAARQRRPDGPRLDVLPPRCLEIDPLFARAERHPSRIGVGRGEIALRHQGMPVEPLGRRRQDEVGVDAVVGQIDGDALVRLPPAGIDRNQRTQERGEQVKRGNRRQPQHRAPHPLHRSPPSTCHSSSRFGLPCMARLPRCPVAALHSGNWSGRSAAW